MSSYHEDECERIWRHLGCEDGGELKIAAIVKHSRYLERIFPELLQQYSEVAERGAVAWEAFLKLYLGTSTPKFSGSHTLSKIAHADGAGHSRHSRDELKHLFDAIDDDMTGSISLANMINHQDLVAEQLPEMLTKWSEIDTNDSGSISWDEFRYFFGDVDDWLEFQLGNVVGLEDLKKQVRRFYRGVMLDAARRKRGHNVGSDGSAYHMIFQGNPGTGKTSMGRLMAQLLHRVGITPQDTLTEVQQEHLVAGYVGQTAPKTQKVIDDAAGGLLFIDEAYRLSQGGKNDFGKEAIEQLMSAMNNPPSKGPIMVFAGYPADMDNFMSQNDGLYRRIPYSFNFTNYSCSEIAEILETMVTKNGFELERQLLTHGRQRLARIVETKTLPTTRALMNGGLCERIFTFAKQALDARDDPSHPSVLLVEADIEFACKRIPPPPGPSGKASSDNGGRSSSNTEEVQDLKDHLKRVQAELGTLQTENAQLRREAAQGSAHDMANATLQPPGAGATILTATNARELSGIQELLKEVRRLKAELQGRDERVAQLEKENQQLSKALHAATTGSGIFSPGTDVQYFSGSIQKWIDAVVVSFDASLGTYDLSVKKNVPPDRVRKRRPAEMPGDASLSAAASSGPPTAPASRRGSRGSSDDGAPPRRGSRASSEEPVPEHRSGRGTTGGGRSLERTEIRRGSRASTEERAPVNDSDRGASRRGNSRPPSQPRSSASTDERSSETQIEAVAAQFRRFDRNGDGTIDRRELELVLQMLDPAAWPKQRVGAVFAAMDKNGDNEIQYQEFLDWAFSISEAYRNGPNTGSQAEGARRLRPEEKAFGRALRKFMSES